MELGERIHQLEEELAVVKTEIRAVLIDLREELLERQGPFMAVAAANQQGDLSEALLPPPIPFPGNRSAQVEAPEWDLEPAPVPANRPPGIPAPAAESRSAQAAEATMEAAVMGWPDAPRDYAETDREWTVLSIASLGKWAEASTKRIGRRRVEELLSVYSALTGRPDERSRSALLRMLDLCNASEEPANVAMNDLVAVLSQLDGIVRAGGGGEATMLSLLAEAA